MRITDFCRVGQGASATQTHHSFENPKYESRTTTRIRLEFSSSYFEFVLDFEFRISDFPRCGGSVSLSLLDPPYKNMNAIHA